MKNPQAASGSNLELGKLFLSLKSITQLSIKVPDPVHSRWRQCQWSVSEIEVLKFRVSDGAFLLIDKKPSLHMRKHLLLILMTFQNDLVVWRA